MKTAETVIFRRAWAMPNKWTFRIPEIAKLIYKYCKDGSGWIDPFAGENSPAEVTNDLNPERPTIYHLHALEFAQTITGEYTGVLFDPPYSTRQVKECYADFGIELLSVADSNQFPNNVKKEMAKKIKTGGYAICFGWNTNGFGKTLGFEIVEILLVAHGGHHNDTIVIVERKFSNPLF